MKDDELQQIRLRMKERRLGLGLTYQALGEKTGMSKSTLQRYETGFIKNLNVDKLEVLAKGLDTTPGYLMGWESKTPTPAKIHDFANATQMEYRDLMKLAGYTEEVYDKDNFFELVFKDSKGNIVDVRRSVKEMIKRNKDWANVAFRASRELSDDDLEALKGMAETYLEMRRKQ